MSFSGIITGLLVFLYQLTGSLGFSIIIFTILLRSALLPLSLKYLRTQKEIKKLQPEIKKLQKKHKDAKKRQQAQIELYKKYNVNPMAGCLPQIVQLVVLILLYRVFLQFLGQTEVLGVVISPQFLWMDLRHPDTTYVLPVLTAVSQLLFSVMILPGGETPDLVPNKSKSKKTQKANEKEEDVAEMAASMQKQMLFIMPVMTGFFASRFPSGLALYWFATTIFSMGQQLVVSGPGGLKTYAQRAFNFIQKK